jgi:hypothetical protein
VRRPTSRLQTDADVGWQSRHEFDQQFRNRGLAAALTDSEH